MKMAFALIVLLCLNTPAVAAEPEPPAPLVEAIARQESGQNPLAFNISGKSYYPATWEEAEQLIQGAVAAGQSFDVGKCRSIAGGWSNYTLIRFLCSIRPPMSIGENGYWRKKSPGTA